MDYDKGLVSALIREGVASLRKAKEKLPSVNYLKGDGKIAYEFAVNFVSQYGSVPSLKFVQEHTGINLDPDPLSSNDEMSAPSEWWIDRLVERKVHSHLQNITETIVNGLESQKPMETLDMLEKALKGVRKDMVNAESGVQSIGQLSTEVLQYYRDLKAGKRGILTPWKGINDATLGIWPQDLGLFVARAGVGKTWTATILALHAWQSGHKVLFATTEISRMRIAMRMLAIKYKFNYNEFRSGRLSTYQEEYFEKQMAEIMNDQNFYVAGGNFDFRIESFTALVEEHQPALCILDGAYLLRVDGNTRTERAANAFDEVKRIANYTSVPMVCTMQFNRQAKSNMSSSTSDLANIGLTDVAGWNADFAYGLSQSDDDKRDGFMNFDPMKVREGSADKVRVRWDLDNMVFDQMADDPAMDGDASESADSLFNPISFKPSDEGDTPF